MQNLAYRPFGGPVGASSAGSSVSNTVDENGRMIVANPGSPMERSYSYDNNGNLTSVTSPGDTVYNATFAYDALNRLTNATGPYGTAAYTYDNVGNRLTKTLNSDTDTYAYVTDTNRIDNIAGTATVNYTYDSNGNVTGIGYRTLVYNQNNRLVRVEENSVVLGEYTYNGLGQRVIKEVDGVETIFHYDFDGKLIAEGLADGTITKEYLYKYMYGVKP